MAWYEQQQQEIPSYGGEMASESSTATLMNSVFQHMALGLAATGFVAMYTVNNPALRSFALNNMIVLIVAQLALVFGLSFLVNKINALTATALFYLYAAVSGLTFAPIFLVYTHGSIATTFFVTGGTFGAMAAYGYVTKKDLTSMGSFLFMGLIGLVIASVVNMFLKSTALMWITTYAGILIFVGLTAYDVQKIKQLTYQVDGAESQKKLGIIGALTLYLDFINLFIMLLRVFGTRRNDDD